MCSRTGWSWDEVWDTLTVPRLKALERHWEQEPPTELLVAAYLGFKGGKSTTTSAKSSKTKAQQVEELFGMFPGGIIK